MYAMMCHAASGREWCRDHWIAPQSNNPLLIGHSSTVNEPYDSKLIGGGPLLLIGTATAPRRVVCLRPYP